MPTLFSSTTLNILTAVGIVAAGIGYLADKFFTGRKQHHTEMDDSQEKLIETLTKQLQAQQQINDSLTGQIHDMQAQLTALAAEVNHLKGVNEANEKKIDDYLQIIAYRNPELDKTLKEIDRVVHDVVPFMEEMKQSHQVIRDGIAALADRPIKRRTKETIESL